MYLLSISQQLGIFHWFQLTHSFSAQDKIVIRYDHYNLTDPDDQISI